MRPPRWMYFQVRPKALANSRSRRALDSDGVVAPEIAGLSLFRLYNPGAGVLRADIKAAQAGNGVIHDQELAMVAIEGPPAKGAFPRPHRMKLADADTALGHFFKHFPVGVETSKRIVDDIDMNAFPRFFTKQIGEGAARVVAGKNVDFQADSHASMPDGVVGREQPFAVLVKLNSGAVGEDNRSRLFPAVIFRSGTNFDANIALVLRPASAARWTCGGAGANPRSSFRSPSAIINIIRYRSLKRLLWIPPIRDNLLYFRRHG